MKQISSFSGDDERAAMRSWRDLARTILIDDLTSVDSHWSTTRQMLIVSSLSLRAGAESLLGEGRGLRLARQSWQMTAARRRTDATLSTETLISGSLMVLIVMGCFLMLFDDGVVAVPYGYHDGYYCRLGRLPVTAAHQDMHNCTESHGQITSHYCTLNIHVK